MANIKVKIISQTNQLYDSECVSVTLPSSSGQITILPYHASLITLLGIGAIILHQPDKSSKEMLINGGTANFLNNELIVLTEEGVASEDLIEGEISEAIKNAEQHKSSNLDAAELIQLEKQLRFEMFKKNFLDR